MVEIARVRTGTRGAALAPARAWSTAWSGKMSGIETRFASEDDAERIRTAFYGFVGRHADVVDGPAHIRTEFDGNGSQLLVRLWSAEAMDAFLRGLDRPARRQCYE
jgi:hypothetical protein